MVLLFVEGWSVEADVRVKIIRGRLARSEVRGTNGEDPFWFESKAPSDGSPFTLS